VIDFTGKVWTKDESQLPYFPKLDEFWGTPFTPKSSHFWIIQLLLSPLPHFRSG